MKKFLGSIIFGILLSVNVFAQGLTIPPGGSPRWKSPVADSASLPATNNTDGDTRVTVNDQSIYIWNAGGAAWILAATPSATVALTGLIGDVTAAGPGSATATIANDAVTNPKMANMASQTFKGRNTAGVGDPEDLSMATARTMLGFTFGDLTSLTTGVTVTGGVGAVNGAGTTVAVQTATGAQPGLLSAADWNTFNNKEPAITATTAADYFRGDKTFQPFDAAARAAVLTGYVSGAGTVAATDTILQAIQKLNGNTALRLASVPAANIVYVDQGGSASCVMGDRGRPCDTYAHAYALIAANLTPPSYGNPYQIEYGIGTFTEPTVTIYPFVRIKGQGIDQTGSSSDYKTLILSPSPFALDASFTTTPSAVIMLSDFSSGGSLQLNINVANGMGDVLHFQNMFFGSNVTIQGDGITTVYFDHSFAYGGFITINGGNAGFFNKTAANKIILNNTGGNDVAADFNDVVSSVEFHQTNPNLISVTLNKLDAMNSSWVNSSTAQTDANLVVESQSTTDFFGFGNQLSTYTSNFNTYWSVFTNSGKYTVSENINDLAIGLATRTVPTVYGTRASPVSISATGFVTNNTNISTSAVDQVVFAAGSTANALTTITAATPISICTLPANRGNHLKIVGASATAPILLPWKTGKLEIKGDFILSNGSIINLVCDGTVWREVSRSQGGGVGADNSVAEGKTAEGFFAPQNLVINSGGEAGSRFAGATVSAGTFATTTTAADVGRGAQSLTWDPTATGQTLTTTQVTIPQGMYGLNCVAGFIYKGADATINWQVWDGTSIIASFNGGSAVTLATSAGWTTQSMGFTCPASGTLGLKFTSTANSAIIKLDSLTIRTQFETGALLTGFSSGAGTVAATDSILTAFNKIDGNVALKAPIASPTFTGIPLAPTAAPGTNNTQIATTAYTDLAVAAGVNAYQSISGNITASGSSKTYYGDTSGGVFTFTLPAAASFSGIIFRVKNITLGGSNNITVARTGADTIEGATSDSITPGEMKFYGSNGTSWYLLQ